MDITTNTVFIAGGTSGLGLGLARRLREAGSTVIIGGRRADRLKTLAEENPGEDLRDPGHFGITRDTVETNLLGTVRVVDAFTPYLLGRGAGTIMTVTSGIAYVPVPLTPAYGITKAGIHSYTESLRAQLAGTGVEVVELIPPLVATELMGPGQLEDPNAMPLQDFVEESVGLMAQQPTPREITVERVKAQRHAVADGTYDQILTRLSGALAAFGH